MAAPFDTILEIVLRVSIVYTVVLAGIRLTGKRELAQVTPFDLLFLLLLANAVQNAMTGPDTSVAGGIAAAMTLMILNTLLARLRLRSGRIRSVLQGSPTLLIHNGRVIEGNLEKEHIDFDDLSHSIREHGIPAIEDVALGVLEIDGTISLIKNDELPAQRRTHHRFRIKHPRG